MRSACCVLLCAESPNVPYLKHVSLERNQLPPCLLLSPVYHVSIEHRADYKAVCALLVPPFCSEENAIRNLKHPLFIKLVTVVTHSNEAYEYSSPESMTVGQTLFEASNRMVTEQDSEWLRTHGSSTRTLPTRNPAQQAFIVV
jgi:hypothetical protein